MVAIVFLGFRVLRGFGVFGNLGNIVGQAIDSIEIERDLSSQLRPPEDSCHSRKNVYFVMVCLIFELSVCIKLA